ncbi:intestinal mucin-like protein [Glandiceps talaboti]
MIFVFLIPGTPTATSIPTTTITPELEVCQGVTNSSRCPDSCPVGQRCDGKKCVDTVDCPCLYEGSLYNSHFINDRCETCSCFNGTVIGCSKHCEIQECPEGEQIVHPDGECCRCECLCRTDEFHCHLSNNALCRDQCIPTPFQCDGTVDCPSGEDEMNCVTPTPTPSPCQGPNGEEIPVGQSVTVDGCSVCTCESDGVLSCTSSACPKTCKIYYDVFQTFDNREYVYEICDHILAMNRESYNTQFEVKVKKNCTRMTEGDTVCDKYLEFTIYQLKIVLSKNYTIHINDQEVHVSQLQQVSSVLMANAGIGISKTGSEIIIHTNFSLFIYWSSMAESRIQVGTQLVDMVQGMCGIPNNSSHDDFTKPNGSLANDEQEFGDSWGSQEECEEKNCIANNPQLAQSAQQQCEILRSDKFAACHGVVDVEYYIGLCKQHVCECLDEGIEEECVCDALTLYVKQCANSDQQIPLEWRTPQFCAPPQCDYPMVWHDCASTCEWTCSAEGLPVSQCETECTAGCTCPSGMVKKGDTCIPIDDCQECYCYGFGDPHYVTFDGSYYPFQGNCSYVAARDTSPSQDFEVLVYNEECVLAPPLTCTLSVTVRYHGDEVILQREQKIIANGVEYQLPPKVTVGGIHVELMGSWILYATVPEINLIVTFDDFNDGFSISIPSNKYFNKTEGMCGVCNYNSKDDFTKRDGQITDSSDEFAFSWLDREDDQTCVSVTPACTRDNYDRAVRKCQEVLYSGVLQQCNVIVNPEPFYRSCLLDTACKDNACDTYASYAKECSRQGLCIDWRNDECPPPVCKGDKIFEPCHKGCREHCENYKFYNTMACDMPDSEGCFCPPGTVANETGQCVPSCEQCIDDSGVTHEVGDEWQQGPCQYHACQPGGVIQTNITECPPIPHCQSPKILVTHQDQNMCCPTHTCVCDCPDVDNTECPIGYILEESLSDDECVCLQHKCVPKEVCLWNNTLTNELEEIQPGTLGLQGVDPCKTCECLEEKESGSEFYTILCSVSVCPVKSPQDCHQDSEYVAPADNTCCGKCEQRWCVDEMGRHEINETWTPVNANNPCDENECRVDSDGMLRIFPTLVSCPPIVPEGCPSPDYELRNDSSGCCQYCAVAPVRNCRLVETEVILEVDECVSAESVMLPYCEGRCSSSSVYSTDTHSIDVNCNCCQAVSSHRKEVTLYCNDNTTMSYQYDFIAGCDCQGCPGDVEV